MIKIKLLFVSQMLFFKIFERKSVSAFCCRCHGRYGSIKRALEEIYFKGFNKCNSHQFTGFTAESVSMLLLRTELGLTRLKHKHNFYKSV